MEIVLTGFSPFGVNRVNSSWEVAKSISREDIYDLNLKIIQLPVSYNLVKLEIDKIIASCCPDILIILGQASKSTEIRLERIAVNLMDATLPDNDGVVSDEKSIVAGGLPAYFCNYPLKKLIVALKNNGLPVVLSNSAGTFVCNTAYYYALYKAYMFKINMKVLFVHLPLLQESINESDATKGLPIELMKQTVCDIIKFITEFNME